MIDEYSMLKSNALYQIDAGLKEIKVKDEWLGGVSVILLGNALQLPPVKGAYISDAPQGESWKLGHQFQSIYDLFCL